MQNYTHIRRLKEAIGDVDMECVVVFVHNNIDFIDSDCVYTIGGMKRYILSHGETLGEAKAAEVAKRIVEFKENPVSTNKEHVKTIRETQKGIREGICPRCGGKLVERTSKKDERRFYGCSNYPKCKFTKPID